MARYISDKDLQDFLNRFKIDMYYYDTDIMTFSGDMAYEELIPLLLPHKTVECIEANGNAFSFYQPNVADREVNTWPKKFVAVRFDGELISLYEAQEQFKKVYESISEKIAVPKAKKADNKINSGLRAFLEANANRFSIFFEREHTTYEGIPAIEKLLSILRTHSASWPKGITVFFDEQPRELSEIKMIDTIEAADILRTIGARP